MRKSQFRHSFLSQEEALAKAAKHGKDEVSDDVRHVLEQVAREDELLARGLAREVTLESQNIDKLVEALRKSLKASTTKS